MSEPYLGEIQFFGFNFAPAGWAMCDGQLLPIASNQALFALLGTTYGGDGRTTFGLPDLRGRAAMHFGNGPGLAPRPMGQKAGQEAVPLTTAQIPAHGHSLVVSAESAELNEPAGNELGSAGIYHAATSDTTMAATSIGITGGNLPHENMEPFLVGNYCIALTGIFPSRD